MQAKISGQFQIFHKNIALCLLTACTTSASPERAVQKATGGYFCLSAFRKKKEKRCVKLQVLQQRNATTSSRHPRALTG